MGEQSTPVTMAACAGAAEAAGLESAWVVDHIAIPPDDAEGSNGRYVDPLIALAWLAGATRSIRLGVGTLVLPYRPALPVAKQIASIQELSGERLLLGVGIGWMEAEFRALGVERRRRGRISDATLAFIRDCFDHDQVTANGQPFLFRPRPARPPIYVGGAAPHALRRAAAYGDGWLPIGMTPERLPGGPRPSTPRSAQRRGGRRVKSWSWEGSPRTTPARRRRCCTASKKGAPAASSSSDATPTTTSIGAA